MKIASERMTSRTPCISISSSIDGDDNICLKGGWEALVSQHMYRTMPGTQQSSINVSCSHCIAIITTVLAALE